MAKTFVRLLIFQVVIVLSLFATGVLSVFKIFAEVGYSWAVALAPLLVAVAGYISFAIVVGRQARALRKELDLSVNEQRKF